MTPEEKAVVQAAIRHYHANPLTHVFSLPGSLGATTQALIYACNECNTDTHRCPGCGEQIEHGDNACQDCGQNGTETHCFECTTDDPRPWCDCASDETCKGPCRRRAHSPQLCPFRLVSVSIEDSGVPESEWRAATFLHILAGDELRMGADTAKVIGASANLWHASVQSQRMMSGKWWDDVTRWEHIEVACVLDINRSGEYTRLSMSPDVPVEILCDAERAALLVLQQAFPRTVEIKGEEQ